MTKYFQLTPDILLEYIYDGDPKLNSDKNSDKNKGYTKDIYDDYPTILLRSEAFTSKYLCFKNESEGLDSLSNLVLPLNNTETQFVVAKSKNKNFFSKTNVSNRFLSRNGSGYLYVDTNYDANINESCDVRYDKCIVHFTSRNYFGSYDSLIFQAYVYMSDKSKLYFASFLFKKTSNLEMTSEHLLYNEKLYTTQIEFDIPSVFAILSKDESIYNKEFNDALKSQNIKLFENTPVGINVYGVTGSAKGTDNYEILKTLKINSISIPYIYNRFDEINIKISEALDGDYFYIDPEMGKAHSSFVDYIESMGEDIRAYMIMHELSLKESWVDNDGSHSEITHKEFHIIDINEDDEDDEISKKFDAKIKYRPICIKGGLNYTATIIDTIKIINTVDSSSYEVTGSLDILNPNKYGKKIKKLDFNNELRPIVNVYNKPISSDINSTGSVTGSKIIGSFSGAFSRFGPGSDGSFSISGSFSGNISGFGHIEGSVSGSISLSELISGIISGVLSSSGGFISGTFSNSSSIDSIFGTIYGYIPGVGYISGTITGSYSNDGLGNITGSITSSNPNSIYGLNSGSNSNSNYNGSVVLNKGGGFTVENMSQNITSFIECTNVGVSVVNLTPDDIN